MVEPDRARQRLVRLRALIGELARVHAGGWPRFAADRARRRATERDLQEAEQIVVDLCADVLADQGREPAATYAELPVQLARAGIIDAALGERLAAAARQRNLLVHLYLDVDERLVFATLEHLDDFRAFVAAIAGLLDG